MARLTAADVEVGNYDQIPRFITSRVERSTRRKTDSVQARHRVRARLTIAAGCLGPREFTRARVRSTIALVYSVIVWDDRDKGPSPTARCRGHCRFLEPAMPRAFNTRTDSILTTLRDGGQYKHLQMLESPMDAVVKMRGANGRVFDALCFCSNNYLGLANHPEVVEAGAKAVKDWGAGTASVRFICGTFSPHETLEREIARFMGTQAAYSFVSAWTANEAVFPTLCEPGDWIISDELNHACIIDAIRLATVIKKGINKSVYKNNTLTGENSLEQRLAEAKAAASKNADGTPSQIWVVTDGVFSMEGSIGDLPTMRKLCDQHDAILVVDDSHGHGVMGKLGRGTHEHFGMIDALGGPTLRVGQTPSHSESGTSPNPPPPPNRVDIFTGTLGKALGGGAGGFVAGPQRVIDLLIQRGRPTLFSNALPVTIAASAQKAIEITLREPQRVQRLRDNVAYARKQIKAAGFDVLESPTAICPIIVHDTAKAIAMSKRLLELGVFVIGFGYPVVPEGHARLRCQISAAHTTQHIDTLVDALKKL
jgi:glycine C-acetyltransferase